MCLCNDIPSLQNSKWLSLLKAMAKICFLLTANIWKILKLIFLMKFFAIQKKVSVTQIFSVVQSLN